MKILSILSALLLSGRSYAAVDAGKLADAIYLAEGGKLAKVPYGVLSIKTSNPRQVCLNSIRNNVRRFGDVTDAEFINRMADRWCPPSADPVGNRNWKRNVAYFYFRKSGDPQKTQ